MKLIIAILCACSVHGAIARIGSCAAGTIATPVNNCTLSAASTGNPNIFFAYRSASTTAPALPSGYTNIGTFPTASGGVTGVARMYCKLATSSGDTGSGTATNATGVLGLSYSGVNAPSNLSASCAGMAVAQGNFQNAKTSTTVTFGTLTILNSNDWVGAFLGTSVTGCTPASGLSSVASTVTVNALDTNGPVSSFSAETCTISSGTWISVTFALLAPPTFPSGGPVLKRAWGFGGNNNTGTTASILTQLEASTDARAAVSGDMIVVALKVPSSGGTITLSDSTGGTNTWTNIFSNTDANSMVEAAYYTCVAATTTSVTIGLVTASFNTQHEIFIFYNTSCSANPIDTQSCASVGAPTTNLGSTIQSGPVTTGGSNEMILQLIWEDTGGNIGLNNAGFASAAGDGQWPLFADVSAGASGGYYSQYSILASAGAINPGFTVVQNTHDSFYSCTVAIKSGSGGAAPGTAISVVKFQDWYTGGVIPTATQFSTHIGNLLVVTSDLGASFNSGSDNNSNSYSLIAGDNTASNPQLDYSCGITPSANMTPVMVIGTGLSGSEALI